MKRAGYGTDDELVEQLFAEYEADEPESAVPLLLIGLGGTGAEVMRRVKWRARWLGMSELVRFLIVDTDPRSKKSTDGYPGFEDGEYVYLNSRAARPILNNPHLHADLRDRLDLDNDKILKAMRDFVFAREWGAGQVPRNATLLLHANLNLFTTQLNGAVKHLRKRWSRMKGRRVAGNVNAFTTIIVGSICGGTGAGTLLDIACILANELKQVNTRVLAILTLPEVYDEVSQGDAVAEKRMKANAYAILRELEYFRSGKALKDGVKLSDEIKTPREDMFRNVSVVGRIDALDHDLGSAAAVYDSIGLYLGAFVGQTLQEMTLGDLCNDSEARDPELGRERNLGTIAATALSLPLAELLGYCAYRQAVDAAEIYIIGSALDSAQAEERANAWLADAGLGAPGDKGGKVLIDSLLGVVDFKASRTSNKLYKATGTRNVHLSDKAFTQRFKKVNSDWQKEGRPALLKQLEAPFEHIETEALANLNDATEKILLESGLRGAQSHLMRVSSVLKATSVELEREFAIDEEGAGKFLENAKGYLQPLTTFLGQLGTDELRQDRVILEVNKSVDLDGKAHMKEKAGKLFSSISRKCDQKLNKITKALESWEEIASYLEEKSAEHRLVETDIPFGESKAELSAVSPAMAEKLYTDNCMNSEGFRERIVAMSGLSYSDFVLTEAAKKRTYKSIVLVAGKHFVNFLRKLDVGTMLENEAREDPDGNNETPIRDNLATIIRDCTPLWRAELPTKKDRFKDTLAVGHSPGAGSTFAAIRDELSQGIIVHEDYTSNIHVAQTSDHMRIYAIRRVVGGLPHYLVDWDEYRKSYEQWQAEAGLNAAHTFSGATTSRLPQMEVGGDPTGGMRYFALGRAFGWIVNRGRYFYLNLYKKDFEDGFKYMVPLISSSDCLAFKDKRVREPLGALGSMVDTRILKFEARRSPRDVRRLGGEDGGWDRAFEEFRKQHSDIELIKQAYGELLDLAGKHSVIADLQNRVEAIKEDFKSGDEAYERQKEEVAALEDEILSQKKGE